MFLPLLLAVVALASCSRGFEFVQISDVQIGFNDVAPYNVSADHFSRVISEVNAINPKFIINTGDRVQSHLDSLQNAIYDSLALAIVPPMWTVPGNHDIRNNQESRDMYMQKLGYKRFAFKKKGCAFIGIDTTPIKLEQTEMEAEQFEWLKEQLEAYKKCRYIFFFSHCPIFAADADEEDGHNNFPLSVRAKYLDLLSSYNVTAAFSGHSHYSTVCEYNGMKMYVAGSVARSDVEDGSLDCGYYRIFVPRSKRKPVEVEYVPFMEKWMEEQEALIYAWDTGKVIIEEAFNAIGMENCFTAEPISDSLMTVMVNGGSWKPETPEYLRDELRFIRIPHRNATGRIQLGEMVVHESIAQDVIDIFSELFKAQYKIECMLLVDKFGADDDRSCLRNNSASFNFRFMTNSKTKISYHGYGRAIDINPFYNPYVKGESIVPAGSEAYAYDRGPHMPYCLYDGDLAVKLFKKHGFTWGGDWHSLKDYMHFEK